MTTANKHFAKPHIIVTGDPVGGFEFYGPFKNFEEACEHGNVDPYLTDEVWWPAPLEALKGEDSISPSSASKR